MKAFKFPLVLWLSLWLAACSSPSQGPVEINIVALNDFHGYIQGSPFSYTDPQHPDVVVTQDAGSIAALGGLLNEMRKKDPQLVFVGAGDLMGASPPLSAMWADEPTIEAMNMLGLEVSSLGNHELDEGTAELMRQIHGGCESSRPEKACKFKDPFGGAKYPYIAANVINTETGKTLVAPYVFKTVRGVKIAFVGAEVEDLASVVSASSMKDLKVLDEADAINHYIPEMKAQGADIIVAIIHQGGNTVARFDDPGCTNLEGDIVDIAQRLDPAVDVLLSAHTHEGYLCHVGHLSVSQGASYGRLVSHLTLVFDPQQHEMLSVQAENLLVDPAKYSDPKLLALQHQVKQRSKAVLERKIARVGAATISRSANRAGESAMGDLVADAQLFATQGMGAQIAIMNSGGIRNEFVMAEGQEQVTYSQVAAVHPFKGTLQLLSLTGAQLQALLEQQWQSDGDGSFKPLQISHTLHYQWDADQPRGQHIVPGSVTVAGKPLEASTTYRITANAFLADGGDNFTVLREAQDRVDTNIPDLQALMQYLQASDAAGKPAGQQAPAGRIVRLH